MTLFAGASEAGGDVSRDWGSWDHHLGGPPGGLTGLLGGLGNSRLGIAPGHDLGDPGTGVFGVRSSHGADHDHRVDATGALDQALQIHEARGVELQRKPPLATIKGRATFRDIPIDPDLQRLVREVLLGREALRIGFGEQHQGGVDVFQSDGHGGDLPLATDLSEQQFRRRTALLFERKTTTGRKSSNRFQQIGQHARAVLVEVAKGASSHAGDFLEESISRSDLRPPET